MIKKKTGQGFQVEDAEKNRSISGILRWMSICLFLMDFTLQTGFGQPWMYNLPNYKSEKQSALNFYDIQKAFNEYWFNRPVERSKGYKPFRRWESFMEPRVYPDGKIQSSALWDESTKLKKLKSLENDSEGYWKSLGPTKPLHWLVSRNLNGNGRINCIAFHPVDEKTLWIGAPSGGIWKTTNGGQTWHTTSDDLPSLGVSDIAVNPENPQVIYIATGDGDAQNTYSVGILKSTDGGLTWQKTGMDLKTSETVVFRRILINPKNPKIMIAASSVGIHYTEDDGVTWEIVRRAEFIDLEFKPGDPNTVYASTKGTSGGRIYKSTNGGKTFTRITDTGFNGDLISRIELAVAPSNPSIVYAVASYILNDGLYGVYKSTDNATTWTLITSGSTINLLGWEKDGKDSGGQGWYDLTMVVAPENENEIYIGGINIWKSVSSGRSWTLESDWLHNNNTTPYLHADHHHIIFHPLTGELYSGNDGGIQKRVNDAWTDLTANIDIMQIYRIGVSQSVDNYVIAGTQDIGTVRFMDNEWKSILGGDGMECIIDPSDKSIIYAELYYGRIRKSINSGNSFQSISPVYNDSGAWISPFVMHPTNYSTLYLAYKDIYKTTNGGQSWTKISNNLTGSNNINALAISRSNPEYIYASSLNLVYMTSNDGKSWKNISTGLPNKAVTRIAISANEPKMAWISYSGFSNGDKVYQTNDAGTTWINYSQGLPNIPVNCIVYQRNSPDALYLGTDLGVFYRNNTMSEWIPYNNGLPNAIVNDLEIRYLSSDNIKLIAGTFGRGLWEAPTSPNAAFVADRTELFVGGQVTFTDQSYLQIDGYEWNFGEGAAPATINTKGPHTVTFTTPGLKTIKLKVSSHGYYDSELKFEYINVYDKNTMEVFPNPNNGIFNLKYISNTQSELTIRVFTLDGRLIYNRSYKKTGDLSIIPIDLSRYARTYFNVQLIDGVERLSKIVLVQ